jgi:branched-chain amino acid aminotransferase
MEVSTVSDSKNQVFFKGNFVPLEDAKVSIMNHCFLYGLGVFEGIRGYWNEDHKQMYLFRVPEHHERLLDSMKIMRMQIKYATDEISRIILEVLKLNAPQVDTYVRVCAYDDVNAIGVSLGEKTELAVFTVPLGDYYHGKGAGLKVCISSWRQVNDNAIPNRAKIVGAYASHALVKSDAMMMGFDEAIVLSEDGNVSEGSAMNLFVVKNGRVATPSTTDRILEGVTRGTVIELIRSEFNKEVEVRPVNRSELYTADEVFLTGTAAQVTPILEIDKRPVGTGNPGEFASALREKYVSICRGENRTYQKWLTPVYPLPVSNKTQAETRVASKS